MRDTPSMKSTRNPLLVLLVATAVVPASAQAKGAVPSTKLERCGERTCLRISGHRDDPAATVLIEQREVAVSGKKRWHVSLPLQTVRNWSAPAARAIAVEIVGKDCTQMKAPLPIGVFGGNTNLAFLSISAP